MILQPHEVMPFRPQPAEAHMRRWPWMILPTYELYAVMNGLQSPPGAGPNSAHVCDFEDGVRLVLAINQEFADAPEMLEVALSAGPTCEMQGIEQAADHWLRVMVERLIDIDPSERPRNMVRHVETCRGVLIGLFEFDRAEEEQQAIVAMRQKGMDPFPLQNYLEIFTVYEHPADYPKSPFILRRQVIVATQDSPEGRGMVAGAWQARTLVEARSLVPDGKLNIGRMDGDDPVIVEVWI